MKNNLLNKLGVCHKVQDYFRGSYVAAENELIFSYGSDREHFSPDIHRIPSTLNIWYAGPEALHTITHIFICTSAMDAIAFLHFYHQKFNKLDTFAFIATGILPSKSQFEFLTVEDRKKKIVLLSNVDLFGKITDVKVAGWLRKKDFKVSYKDQHNVSIQYRDKAYQISEDNMSLNAFEVVSGFRSKVRTHKPLKCQSFTQQLKSEI